MTTGTPCDEIAAEAVGLLALPAEAPERARAEEHARACAACARALAEGRRVLTRLDAATLPPPSPAALARASATVLAELDAAGARAGAGRIAAAVAAAVVAAWALPLALARGPIAAVGSSPFALSFGLAALAAIAAAATVRWGGRLAVAFPILSVVTALVAGTGRALDATSGLHCVAIETMTAGGVAAVAWLATKGLAPSTPKPEVVVAAVGGGALAGHAALHLACGGATELPHLLVFHAGPVALVVGLALVVAASTRRARQVRESSRP